MYTRKLNMYTKYSDQLSKHTFMILD